MENNNKSATRKRGHNGSPKGKSPSKRGRGNNNIQPRNNVSTLRIARPPVRGEEEYVIAKYMHQIRKLKEDLKTRTNVTEEQRIDAVSRILADIRKAQEVLIDALMKRAGTPGRFNPEDARLLKESHEEYKEFMDLFLAHVKPRGPK